MVGDPPHKKGKEKARKAQQIKKDPSKDMSCQTKPIFGGIFAESFYKNLD